MFDRNFLIVQQQRREKFRKNIQEYVEKNKHDPLYFSADKTNEESLFSSNSFRDYALTDLTYKILGLTDLFPSRELTTKKFQCYAGSNRSSLDIWRHIIYFRPEISIYSVMEILYSFENYLYSNMCSDVKRRVFKLANEDDSFYDEDKKDEYGMTFNDWEKINQV